MYTDNVCVCCVLFDVQQCAFSENHEILRVDIHMLNQAKKYKVAPNFCESGSLKRTPENTGRIEKRVKKLEREAAEQ